MAGPDIQELMRTTLHNRGWRSEDSDQSDDLCVVKDGNVTIIVDVSSLPENISERVEALKMRITLAERKVAGCRHVG